MSLIKAVFNKNISEIQLSDLESFFSTEQEESSILEFKDGRTTIESVYREVVAFLNSEGGILIIGSPTEEARANNKKVKFCKGKLTPATIITSQDTLLRCLASNILPCPSGIKARTITLPDGNAYILEIPQSMTPPHQVAPTGIYYIRLERDSHPAPHGIVEALFQRRQRPNLNISVRGFKRIGSVVDAVTVSIKIVNDSIITADDVSFKVTINGVKSICSIADLSYQFEDEQLTITSDKPGVMLVKNLEIEHKFEFVPLHTKFTFNVIYYCRHDQAYLEHFLINSDGILLASVKSKDDEYSALSESFSDGFEKYRLKCLTDMIEFNEGTHAEPLEDPDEMYIRCAECNVVFSRSLATFYEFTNGFNGKIGSYKFKMFKYERLLQSKNHVEIGGVNYAFIANFGRQGILYRIDSEGGLFGFAYNSNGVTKFASVANNLVVLFNRIVNDELVNWYNTLN